MPRNEEEVMRNILTLSNQLKFVDDLPQVNTSFEKQTDKFLVFTVVLARVLKENASSIKHELNKGVTSFTYSVDRVKLVGKLRNKYPKEATVIRAFLPDRKFLRDDQSVDLFYARQNLVKELRAILGDFRDFNGGMLSKQKEAFDLFVNELHKDERIQRPLVEKFFHSIFPVEKRSLINPLEISFLYRMFLKMINAKSEKKELDSSGGVLYVLLSFEGVEKAEDFLDEITKLNLSRRDVTKIQLNVYDRTYIGLIINNSLDDENVEVFSTISSLVL